MYSWYSGAATEGEGIAQKITPLSEGNAYAMSFFKKLAGSGLEKMGKLYLVLLHCEDYQSIHKYPSYTIPTLPLNSQVIYCENSVANTDWQQVFACFRAIDDYDLVWIFPVQDIATETFRGLSGVDFSGLEMINTTNFSAGVMPSPTYATPVVNIGPETPNCKLRNAVFTWLSPNAQIVNSAPNQTINVDASDSLLRGEWTLRMSVPVQAGKNNPCKLLCNVSASTIVPLARKPWASPIKCDLVSSPNCNLIQNNAFIKACGPAVSLPNELDNPFYLNCVDHWDYGFQTPQLNVFFNPLNANYNTASMWSYSKLGVYQDAWGEGIATGMPKLIPGHRYIFSFFKAAVPQTGGNTAVLDEFNAYLINCSDYQQMEASLSTPIPAIPNGAQRIYCETNVTNGILQRVSICFNANSDYNVLWIFPRQWTWGAQQWWLGVAQPELIDVNGFTAGPVRAINPSNCNVIIGPNIPNCGPSGATFIWYPPNSGSPIVATSTQQISVNASLSQNVGTWTLKMIVPNTVSTNNTCSDNTYIIQATVNVSTQGCIIPGPTAITTASYFAYGACNPPAPTNTQIVPGSNNISTCHFWECGGQAHFFSNINNNNNQWYVNDILITMSGSSPNTGYVNIDDPQQLIIGLSSGSTQSFKVQLKNTTFGYQQLTTPTYIYFATKFASSDFIFGYKPNYTGTYSTPFNIVSGPNATYTWSVYGTTIFDASNLTPNVQITFPPNAPIPTLNGTLTVANSYCNSSYPITFQHNINLRSQNITRKDANTISLYPNPALTRTTISSTENIVSVEITSIMIPATKKINYKNKKEVIIDISDLVPGVYNCRITTEKGISNKKLIVKR